MLQIGAVNGDETPGTTTRAHGGETTIVEALVETVLGADLRAARLQENLLEETMTDPAGSAENALQTLQTRIAEEIDTAVIDIATTATATTNARQGDIEAHDLGLDLVLPAGHTLHRTH